MKNWILIFITAFTFLSITDIGKIINNSPEIKEVYNADIIIYGGTSASIIAAVEVVKTGKTVLIVSPDQHLGGLTSGGLGFTDTGNKAVIGGLSREFYHRVWLHYKDAAAWNWQNQSDFGNKGQGTVAMDGEFRTMWLFEPHVAEKVFEDFVRENNIKVLRGEWLDRNKGVVKKKGEIISFSTLSGKVFKGKMFIDATYEGDLMAAAGINFHVGREGNAKYNETFNGVQTGVFQHNHHFKSNISPYKIKDDPSSGLLPYISAEPPGEFGAADKKIQAYCFRMCMTNHPENSVAFPKPDNYDASKYELLLREFNSGRNDWFSKFDVLPNKKTDTNNHGAFSSDFIGMNYDYPEADYQRRAEIIKQHYDYQAGLLWFVANDSRVPDAIRTKMATYGLAKDEFKDNNHWPHQIYVRESRRMIGDYITTEHDVMQRIETPEFIGMGSYHIDSHNTQRYVTSEGYVQNEGDIGVKPPGPYRISYGSIIPKKEECSNLFVPVCVSSSHIAYGSIRMEPVFMILGQSAAVAACLAIDEKCAIQDVSYNQLKKLLENKNQILTN
ncbi:MAG: FAD-dependent oxidoreductase [Bacteroidetes bacterium]|nr:FAD-dependent oxidoreductase [Bacteroidota bacterium]